MATYLELQTDIADEMLDQGAITSDHIKKAIIRSIAYYERKRFWFTEAASTFSTVSNQPSYGVADLAAIPDIVEILNMQINGTATNILGIDQAEMEAMQFGYSFGIPQYYSVFGGLIYFYPIPDAAYTVSIRYVSRLTPLVDDTDSNGWTTYGEEMIRQSAKYRLALDVLHADEIALRYRGAASEAYDNLLEENRKRNSDKTLRPHGMPATSSTFNILLGM